MDNESNRNLLLARRFCYGFFAAFFLDPRRLPVAEAWANAAQLVEELHAIAFEHEAETILAPPYPAARDELEAEFARLFYGVGIHTVASAESCWESDLRLHCQGAFHSVREFYTRHGRAALDSLGLPDDHLAVELAFMHELIGEAGSDSTQRDFLVEHLGRWAPLVCDDIERHSRLALMRCVARSLRRLIAADLEWLSRASVATG